jgi:predicted transcriptional regulator
MEEKSFKNENNANESETTDTTKKRTRTIRKTKYPLPNSDVSVEKLINVIQALCTSSNKGETPVSYHDVAPYTDMHKTRVSGALSFLYDVGLVAKEKHKYTPKQEIVDFCSRLAFKDPNAGTVLRANFWGTWFGEHIVKLLGIRSEMTQEDLMRILKNPADEIVNYINDC